MEQTVVFITLFLALFFFVWGKFRYDIVAFLALFVLVVFNIVPADNAFTGLAHPAVITVAAVLVISKALQYSGLVDVIAGWVSKISSKKYWQIILLCTIVAFASAVINNIGALAIIMPVALHLSRKNGYSPSIILMPIAFASILGGMITLIGTPPNIIIASFRSDEMGSAFSMFDFTPVGTLLTIAGLIIITLGGWRLLPKRQAKVTSNNMFEIENYITEILVPEEAKLIGVSLNNIRKTTGTDILVLGIIRNEFRLHAPSAYEEIQKGDILIVESDADELKNFLDASKTILAEGEPLRRKVKGGEEIKTIEAVVMPNSLLIGNSAETFRIRSQYNINILAVARQNKKINKRISKIKIKSGDVLLLQGVDLNLQEAIKALQCFPLAKREISIGKPKRIFVALSIFLATIALVVANLLPVDIAFSLAAVAMVMTNILPIKEVYYSVDWPVIILLAAMIPVGEAFETSGGAATITELILYAGTESPTWLFLGILMTITMLLSNVINNAATVVLMAPIAVSIANTFSLSPDPFLMTVAVGASCAFLTPIGHQSNTLVMGPGGYKFSDYWKLGLPLSLVILFLGVPLILYFWPI